MSPCLLVSMAPLFSVHVAQFSYLEIADAIFEGARDARG
jgi:hypothetical protein